MGQMPQLYANDNSETQLIISDLESFESVHKKARIVSQENSVRRRKRDSKAVPISIHPFESMNMIDNIHKEILNESDMK